MFVKDYMRSKRIKSNKTCVPFGFLSDGLNDETSFVDADGDRWYADEYGDRSYMWDYM